MPPTVAFRCVLVHPIHTLPRALLSFPDRHARKVFCCVCEKRTWWMPEDSTGEEIVVTVKRWGTATGGVILVHRRWIGKRVRVALA